MKLTRILCLLLALCMALGCAGLASSGEASGGSGGMGGAKLIAVSGDKTTISDDENWTVEGELSADAAKVAGIRFTACSIGQSFMSVSSSEHVDALAEGFTAVVGDENEVYEAPGFAELFSNDGLNPNAEGFDLDYRWIGQIDWDESSPDYGRYTPVTAGGQAILDEVLDGAYSNVVLGGATEGETANRGPTQLSCSGGAALLVRNTFLYSEGLEGLAVSNNGSSGKGSTMVVKDSLFVTRGYVPASAGTSENLPNDPLLVTGADRTNLSGGESKTYYYDSAVVVDGWASLSTDGASGDGVDLVAVNTFASALLGGYGTYADGNCRDYFYGSVLEGAEIGVIIAGTGEVSVFDGDEGVAGGTGCAVGREHEIDPYAFADEDDAARYAALGGSVIAGGRYAVMIHVAGLAAVERQGIFYAKDSTLLTDRALYSDEDVEYSVNASWYGRELSPNIQKYIEYTEGDLILLRGTNADVVLDGVTMESYNGVLIHSVLNSDTSTPETPAGSGAVGSLVTLKDMDVAGNILDEDYERAMAITLDGATLTGRIVSGTCADWTNRWLRAGYVEDYTIGYASNTFGAEAPLDAFVHALRFDGDAFSYEPYGDNQGTSLTLANGAIWVVTGESSLSSLTVDARSEVWGVMTVNGVETPIGSGSYEGEIVLTPLASGEPSAE